MRAGFFSFLATLGLIAGVAALAGFANALLRDGGAAVPRWLVLIAVAAFGSALIVAPFVDHSAPGTARGLGAGIAAAGSLTAGAVAVRWIAEEGGSGPLEIAVFVAGVGLAMASPWLASRTVTTRVLDASAGVGADIEADLSSAADSPAPAGRFEMALVAGGVLILIGALAYVLPDGPLGHDESVYALKARSWVEGTPDTGFGIYRPVGMPVVGLVVLQFSDSEVAFRTAATILAATTALGMWAIGRTMLGPVAALLGTAVFVVSESFLRRATEFLNDLTSAGLLLGVMFFVWLHFERYPERWWLLAAAPLGAAAYYVRYGSVLALAVIAVAAVALWFPRIGKSWRQIAATAGALLALLLPHFVYSQNLTGSPLGVFRSAPGAVGGGGGGLADYVEWFPEHLAGTFGAMLMVAGVAYTILVVILAGRHPRLAPAARTATFLTATALVLTVVLGLFTHGEPRFVYLPLMALLLVGGQAVAVLLQRLPNTARRLAAAGLILLVAYAMASAAGEMHNRLDSITGSRDVLAETGDVVEADAGNRTCTVESAYIPQLTWYSVCATYGFGYNGPDGEAAYLVFFEESGRQPTGAQLEELLGDTSGEPLVVVPDDDDVYGDGHVYEFVDPSG